MPHATEDWKNRTSQNLVTVYETLDLDLWPETGIIFSYEF